MISAVGFSRARAPAPHNHADPNIISQSCLRQGDRKKDRSAAGKNPPSRISLLRSRRSRNLRRRIRPAHDRAEEARSRTSRTDHARLSHPARRRQAARRIPQGAALLAHALARQHLQRRRTAQLGAARARTQRPRRHRLRLRTEARRHVAGPALREWQAGPRHHARRRHHRRRRHPECAHGALHPAFHSAGQAEESRNSRRLRSPRRNADAHRGLQENERRARAEGTGNIRQPAQCHSRHGPAT